MSALHARRRATDVERLAHRTRPVDLLVIGGGITGVGVALDAASRGLETVLVEAHDLAFGTSRWSSKLVHGGLRYLASGQLAVAHESAVERHHLMTRIAPHLITPLRQVVPDRGPRAPVAAIRAGFWLGDGLRRAARTPSSVLPAPTRWSVARTTEACPTIRPFGLRGSIVGADGQLVDDARLVVAVARTAAGYGATICTALRADNVTGRGADLHDTVSGASFHLAANAVVNATGVWAGDVDPGLRVRPSRGTHLVFDAATFGHPTAALTIPVDGSVSRFVFAMPEQLGRVYLGLTDVDAPGPVPDVPEAADDEIDFLLDAVNVALRSPLTRADIIGTYSGLRPLVGDARAETADAGDAAAAGPPGDLADVSRRHRVTVRDGSLVSVVGGKLTTYRRMAQDAVDAAVSAAGLTARDCVTADLALIGAAGPTPSAHLPASLIARYGSEADAVAATAVADPLAPVAEGIDVTRAEVGFAVTHEGALTVDDVLHRRTRIGLVDADADAARQAVTEIVEDLRDRSA